MKAAVVKSFGAKGEKIVNMNHEAITKGEQNIKRLKFRLNGQMLRKQKLTTATFRNLLRIS